MQNQKLCKNFSGL